MLPEEEIMGIYNKYKVKYNKLESKSEIDMDYVSERVEIKKIIGLLEKILQLNDSGD